MNKVLNRLTRCVNALRNSVTNLPRPNAEREENKVFINHLWGRMKKKTWDPNTLVCHATSATAPS